jgi:hypothetical protein
MSTNTHKAVNAHRMDRCILNLHIVEWFVEIRTVPNSRRIRGHRTTPYSAASGTERANQNGAARSSRPALGLNCRQAEGRNASRIYSGIISAHRR